jgi:hypothetical protein
MQLFQLLFGKSKKKMRVIMIDSYKKCENYCFARQNVVGFHRIEQAPIGATVWKQKTCTIGGNKYEAGKNNGWIGKNGFNPHT